MGRTGRNLHGQQGFLFLYKGLFLLELLSHFFSFGNIGSFIKDPKRCIVFPSLDWCFFLLFEIPGFVVTTHVECVICSYWRQGWGYLL